MTTNKDMVKTANEALVANDVDLKDIEGNLSYVRGILFGSKGFWLYNTDKAYPGVELEMWRILLVCIAMLMGCQRLRLEVDDLKLRCGTDANLVDIEQWIDISTDYGKPSPGSVNAVIINEKMEVQSLPISSRGCVGKPYGSSEKHWLSVRVEEGGTFGRTLALQNPVPWKLQLKKIIDENPRLECPKNEYIGGEQSNDEYVFGMHVPVERGLESFHIEVKLPGNPVNNGDIAGDLLVKTEGNQARLNLQKMKEGSYQIELNLYDLSSFRPAVKTVSRKCSVTIDRTPPKIQPLGRDGVSLSGTMFRASPGEAIEFKVSDQTNTQVFSCFAIKGESERAKTCDFYAESGRKITAPSEGEWTLSVYSVDAAGNKSQIEEFTVTVFDSEKVRAISGWLEEAKLYINQKDYLTALFRLAKAFHGFNKLQTELEKSSIRTRLIAPLLQVLYKKVPYARFVSDGVNIDAVYPLEGDRLAIVAGSIFRAGETEVKLMRVGGEIVKNIVFQEKISIFHNAIDHRLLVINIDGSYRSYNASLELVEEGVNSNFPVHYFGRNPMSTNVAGRTFAYTYNNATYALDLLTAQAHKIIDGTAGIALSPSGEWVSVHMNNELFIYSSKSKLPHRVPLGFEIKKTVLSQAADFICYMGLKNLLCGPMADLYAGKIYLQNELAGRGIAIDKNAARIAYAGTEGLYLVDRKDVTHYKKTFYGPVLQIFFDHDDKLMVDTILGRRSWDELIDGFDASTSDQTIAVTKDQYWLPKTNIFVKKVGQSSELVFLDAEGKSQKITIDVDMSRYLNVFQTIDRKFLVVASNKDIEIISLGLQLGDGFTQPCNRLSYDGELCALAGLGQLKIGRRVSDRGFFDFEMQTLENPSPWQDIVWNDVQPGRFAVWSGDEIGIGRMHAGKAIIEQRISTSYFLSVKWIGGRYLAWVEDSLKIFDSIKGEYIGDFSGSSAETLFNPPVDFSTEMSLFAAVLREQEGHLSLRLIRSQDGSELGSWQFKKLGQEQADLVRFSDDGKELLLGFHDGAVQILPSSQIKQQKYEPKVIAQHADSVMAGGFMKTQGTAYTLSMDGALLYHDYGRKVPPVFQGNATFPVDDSILYAGTVEKDNLIWVSDQGILQIFDPDRRNFDQVAGGRTYFRNNFLVAMKTQNSSYLIDFVNLNYLPKLCSWLLPSLRYGVFKSEESSSVCL